MKKFASILLIAVFIFNMFGYKLLFDYLSHRQDELIEATLDKDQYNEQDLVTLKFPFSMPYQSENPDYERVKGQIRLNGIVYRYVKRKFEHGYIVLQCLPDYNKTKMESGKDEFFKLANEFQQFSPLKHSGNKTVAIFRLGVYDSHIQKFLGTCHLLNNTEYFTDYMEPLQNPLLKVAVKPPDKAIV